MPKPPQRSRDVAPGEKIASKTCLQSDLVGLHAARSAPENTNAGAAPTYPPRPPRAELKVEIGIDDHTDFYVGFGENVSAGGVFVATYRLLPVGTEVALAFVLPDESPLFVHGRVRWRREAHDRVGSEAPPGMGIQFTGLGDVEQKQLQAHAEGRDSRSDPKR